MWRGRLGGRPRAVFAAVVLAGGLTATSSVPGTSAVPVAEAAGTVSPQPVAPQPVALWRLDDGGGSLAREAMSGRDGIAHGAVTFGSVAQGPTTTAAAFDGRSGFIEVPTDGTTGRVVAASAWVRLVRGTAGGLVVDGTPVNLGVAAGHPAASACAAAGCAVVRAANDIRDGAWHHLAASVSGSTLTLSVDGAAAARTPIAGPPAPWQGGAIIGPAVRGDIDEVALYAAPLPAAVIAAQFRGGACPQDTSPASPPTTARRPLPALPLHTSGRFVVDAHGHRVKLAGVNWYGADELDRVPAGLQCQSIDAIAAHIAANGFNVVRLPWSTDTWVGAAPRVTPVAVAANPQLRGMDARRVFDAVVAGLARHGLMVILDNHVSRADWCCSGTDGNALWWGGYNPKHPPLWAQMSTRARTAYFRAGQGRWLRAWAAVAGRYGPRGAHPTSAVVAADLRNEPRTDATLRVAAAWTARKLPAWSDWAAAAEAAGNTVLRANPRLLIAVEGVHYANDLRGAATRQIHLATAHRLIYSAHDYAFFHGGAVTATALRDRLGQRWGYLLATGHRWTAPVWVGEWGACHPDGPSCGDAAWLSAFTSYLRDGDLDFTYWSINGTGARGRDEPISCGQTPRFPGCPEGYGISDDTWAGDASRALSGTLRALIPTTQRP